MCDNYVINMGGASNEKDKIHLHYINNSVIDIGYILGNWRGYSPRANP